MKDFEIDDVDEREELDMITSSTEAATQQMMMKIEDEIIDAIEDGYDGMDVIFDHHVEQESFMKASFGVKIRIEKWANDPPEYDEFISPQRYDWRHLSDEKIEEVVQEYHRKRNL